MRAACSTTPIPAPAPPPSTCPPRHSTNSRGPHQIESFQSIEVSDGVRPLVESRYTSSSPGSTRGPARRATMLRAATVMPSAPSSSRPPFLRHLQQKRRLRMLLKRSRSHPVRRVHHCSISRPRCGSCCSSFPKPCCSGLLDAQFTFSVGSRRLMVLLAMGPSHRAHVAWRVQRDLLGLLWSAYDASMRAGSALAAAMSFGELQVPERHAIPRWLWQNCC